MVIVRYTFRGYWWLRVGFPSCKKKCYFDQYPVMLMPHMEVSHKELAFIDTLMKKESQLPRHEGLVDLVANLEIKIHSSNKTCDK